MLCAPGSAVLMYRAGDLDAVRAQEYSCTRHGLSENANPSLVPTIPNAGFAGKGWEHCGHETSLPPMVGGGGGGSVVVVVVEVVVVEVVVVEVVVVEGGRRRAHAAEPKTTV